jgi:hypothetical protein
MSLNKFNPRTIVLFLFIAFAAVMRVASASYSLGPLTNFTPIGAMALFGGTYYNSKWKGFLFPLLTLFVSDLVLQQTVYKSMSNGILYSGWYWTYAAFAVIVLIGMTTIKKVSFQNVAFAAIVSAVSYWLIVDFATWFGGSINVNTMQPLSRDIFGLTQCYIQGIPFIKNLLMGNLVYSFVFFGGF